MSVKTVQEVVFRATQIFEAAAKSGRGTSHQMRLGNALTSLGRLALAKDAQVAGSIGEFAIHLFAYADGIGKDPEACFLKQAAGRGILGNLDDALRAVSESAAFEKPSAGKLVQSLTIGIGKCEFRTQRPDKDENLEALIGLQIHALVRLAALHGCDVEHCMLLHMKRK